MIQFLQIIFLTLFLVAVIMYFVYKADLEVAFIKGFLVGFSYNDTDYPDDNETDHVAQIGLGIVVFNLTWTDTYGN